MPAVRLTTGSFGLLLSLLLCGAGAAQMQTGSEPLTVTKVDPPNWFATLPKPLLLLRGTGFTGAQFRLSDPALRVEHTAVSANGHWAQLQLTASPNTAETVKIDVQAHGQRLHIPFRFAAPRAPGDGMQGFSPRDALYLIMTDRFANGNSGNDGLDARHAAGSAEAAAERAKPRGWHGGDLQGVLQHLPYLQDLGVTTVWLTPVYVNDEPQSYHGYGATDYYGVDPHFGSLHDLQALAAALHAHHMKLVLDTVPNHVGPAHPWVTDEPTPDWFHGTRADHLHASPDFASLLNPHAPERDRLPTLHGWFANALPDMNTEDPAVAQYLRQNAVWWIEETGADGLRIDTFAFVDRPFWNSFNGELKQLFPHLTEVGEVFDPHPEITSAFADGVTRAGVDTRLYTPFDFPTYFAIRDVFAKGKPMSELAGVLAADELFPHPERLVPFAGNHDTSRFAEEVPDPALRSLAFAYLLTTRGTPQIYSGDEIAMPGGNDPANRQDFPGGFASATPGNDAFQTAGRSPAQEESYRWVKQLLELRREHDVLACGEEQVLTAGQDVLAYVRYGVEACTGTHPISADAPLIVVLERGHPAPVTLDLQATAIAGCQPQAPLLGQADIQSVHGQLSIHPRDAALVIPCRKLAGSTASLRGEAGKASSMARR